MWKEIDPDRISAFLKDLRKLSLQHGLYVNAMDGFCLRELDDEERGEDFGYGCWKYDFELYWNKEGEKDLSTKFKVIK